MTEKIRIHVVYNGPKDLPDWIVIRGHRGETLDSLRPEPGAVAFEDLTTAHAYLRALQLVPFQKDPESDPRILEVWAPIRTEWPWPRKSE